MSSFYCLPNMATTLNKAASDEGRRFLLLRERDGMDAAVPWVKRTIKLYEEAISRPGHYASMQPYRASFEASLKALKAIITLVEEGRLDEIRRAAERRED